MADKNYVDFYMDEKTNKEGMEIAGKNVIRLDAPEVLLSPDTPLLTNAQDVAGAINELFNEGGGGGDDDEWKFPESWPDIPEPSAKQIVMLIEIPETPQSYGGVNQPSLRLNFYPYGNANCSIDWGDGCISHPIDTYSYDMTHFYHEAGLYIITMSGVSDTAHMYIQNGQFTGNLITNTPVSDDDMVIYISVPSHQGCIRAIKFGSEMRTDNVISGFENYTGLVYLKFCGNSFDFKFNHALSNLYSLKRMDVEKTEAKSIGDYYNFNFASNWCLEKIDFTKNIPDLSQLNISNCYALKKIDLTSAKIINSSVFTGQNSDVEEINAPNLESLTSSITGNYSLKKIYAPKLTDLPENCFNNCYNLEEVYTPSLMNVPANAFQECYSLQKFTYAEGCNFNGNTFENCPQLYPKPQ